MNDLWPDIEIFYAAWSYCSHTGNQWSEAQRSQVSCEGTQGGKMVTSLVSSFRTLAVSFQFFPLYYTALGSPIYLPLTFVELKNLQRTLDCLQMIFFVYIHSHRKILHTYVLCTPSDRGGKETKTKNNPPKALLFRNEQFSLQKSYKSCLFLSLNSLNILLLCS